MSDVERLRAAAGGRCATRGVPALGKFLQYVTRFAMACRVRAGADRAPLPAGPIKTT